MPAKIKTPMISSIRSRLVVAALVLLASAAASAFAEDAPDWSFLPDRHVLVAEHDAIDYPCRTEVSLSRDLARNGDYLTYLVGNDIAWLGLDLGSGDRFAFGGMGFIRAEIELSSGGGALQCGDYQVGLCSSYAGRALAIELAYYHLSSHYGDDYLRDHSPSADDIGWEAFRLLVSLPEESPLRPYAVAECKTGRRPRDSIDDVASLLGGLAWTAPFRSFPARLSAETQLLLPDRDFAFGLRLDCPLIAARPARPGGRAFGHSLFLGWNRGPSKEGVFYGVMENRFTAGFSLTI
jgi:hypothetical protein